MTTIPNIQTDTLNWYLRHGYSQEDYEMLDRILCYRIFTAGGCNRVICEWMVWADNMIQNHVVEVREILEELYTITGNPADDLCHLETRLGRSPTRKPHKFAPYST